jgi:hypothetical protein
MLYSFAQIRAFGIQATDGPAGSLFDLLLDESSWKVRRLVVSIEELLSERSLVISPRAVTHIDPAASSIYVRLSRSQVESAPAWESIETVAQLKQEELAEQEGKPDDPLGFQEGYAYAPPPAPGKRDPDRASLGEPDTTLHSVHEMYHYDIEAGGELAGYLEDLIIEGEDWTIRRLVVDTGRLLPSRKVLLNTSDVESIRWEDKTIRVRGTKGGVDAAPPAD